MPDRPAGKLEGNYEIVSQGGPFRLKVVVLPEGMPLDLANEAAELIARWEDSDRSNRDLAIELFRLFNRRKVGGR